MKKNFFKKLSFVMALAMMVTMIAPAAGALAASGPALNSTKKYLHLSGITGASEYDFNISGKKDGWKFSWTSANEDVAVVDAKNGQTVAKGVGTTKVTVAITDAEGNDVKELSADVVVRDNIETVAITNAPTAALAINQEWDFNRSFVTESGSTAATSSVTRWTVDKDTTATITAGGLFKATAAGDYKVTAMSFQSKAKYEAWKVSKDEKLVLATADVTVKVASEIKSVTQVNGTTVKVEFTSAMESVTAADLTVSYLVSSTPILQTVKSITASDDKKTFTVVLYAPFAAGSSYRVAYKDMKAVDFTAATANVADVASVVITPATVVKETATDVVVKLFDKNGVDISNAALLSRVTLTNSSDKVWFNTAASHVDNVTAHNELTMYNLGDTTTITGIFHTYEYDTTTGTEKGTVTGATTVTCVAATSYSVGTITAWSIATSAPTDSFASVNHIFAVGDVGNLYVRSLKTDGTTYLSNTGVTGDNDASRWRLTSSDTNVLYISGNSLLPLKAGSSTVVVEYAPVGSTTYTVVGTVVVTVTAARVATNLKLDATSFTLSKAANVLDSKTVGIDVEDQYGVDMPESGVSVSKVVTDASLVSDLVSGGASNLSSNSDSVTFNGANMLAGTYNYKITANGLSRNVIITVIAPKDAAGADTSATAYYKLSLSGSSFDVVLASDNTSEVATLKVVGYAANGVANDIVAASGNAVGYSVQIIDPDGTDVSNSYLVNGASSTSITLANIATSASGTAVQAKTGTWTVKLIYTSTGVVKDVVTFVVKNSQVKPVVTAAKLTTSATTLSAAISDLFTATLNGTTITGLYVVASEDIFGTGTTVFVKNVRYKDALGIIYTVSVQQKVNFTAYNHQ